MVAFLIMRIAVGSDLIDEKNGSRENFRIPSRASPNSVARWLRIFLMRGKGFQRSSGKSWWEQESSVFYFTTIVAVFASLKSSHCQVVLFSSSGLWKPQALSSFFQLQSVTWQFLLPLVLLSLWCLGRRANGPALGEWGEDAVWELNKLGP